MCVLFLAIDQHPRWRVVLASNRDEQYERSTRPADRWEDCPRVIAGRDEEAGGTWLGVREDLAWTVVTNVRDLPAHREGARSRGDLPRQFLCGGGSPSRYIRDMHGAREAFNPFNLLVARGDEVWYGSTHTEAPERLTAGIYGLSNATLDVPWPKVRRGKAALAELLGTPDLSPAPLFSLLDDAEPAPDPDLPETGVGLDWERVLSPIFIASERYGTRAQSVLLLDREGGGLFVERTTTPGLPASERAFTLGSRLPGATP
ncbi:MAG TPA: NRDE family protein [Bacteroidetes bacterium]|nr:NRDE family protein [Bacteroidota bacterium]HIL58011.1 NRDE family protein [Rhodothermales bacterium]